MANTGYWMPFEAAKAVAATFCWRIRYALTPVFGPGFPKMCLRPETEGFGTMVIDPAITQYCTKQADLYRQLEIKASCGPASVMRSPLTPESPTLPKHGKQLRPKARQLGDDAGGFNSELGFEDSCVATSVSPSMPYCNTWTAANTPRSAGVLLHDRLPSPRELLAGMSAEAGEAGEEDHKKSADSASTSSTTSLLLRSGPEPHDENDECDEGTGCSCESSDAKSNLEESTGRRLESSRLSDEKAAYLLLKLSMEAGVSEAPRGEKRRAST